MYYFRFIDEKSVDIFNMNDKNETSAIVDCMMESLNLLTNILDYEHKDDEDLEDERERIKNRTKYYYKDENGDRVEVKDILKENYELKKNYFLEAAADREGK